MLSLTFVLSSCSRDKKVKLEETNQFIKEMKEVNTNISNIRFYHRRPGLRSEIILDKDELSQLELEEIVKGYKELVNTNLLEKVSNKYAKGVKLSRCTVDILNSKKERLYYLATYYVKKHNVDERIPSNIDGYKTWYIDDGYSDPEKFIFKEKYLDLN